MKSAGYFWVFATVVLTVYGQLAFKWRADQAAEIPFGLGARIEYALRIAFDPWMISVVLSVAAASVTWWLALREFELSFAYPFMALSFIGVLLGSAAFFGERMTAAKVIGVALVFAGLVVASRN